MRGRSSCKSRIDVMFCVTCARASNCAARRWMRWFATSSSCERVSRSRVRSATRSSNPPIKSFRSLAILLNVFARFSTSSPVVISICWFKSPAAKAWAPSVSFLIGSVSAFPVTNPKPLPIATAIRSTPRTARANGPSGARRSCSWTSTPTTPTRLPLLSSSGA